MTLPLLKLLEDGHTHTKHEVMEKLKIHFSVTDEEWKELVPSKTRRKFDVRILWAVSQLRHALLLKNIRLGEFKITDRGLKVLAKNPKKLDNKFLKQYVEYREFLGLEKNLVHTKSQTSIDDSPLEIFEESYEKMMNILSDEILGLVKRCTPDAFERLVVQLVVKIGYGGTVEDAGKALGKSGDEGIDGVIKDDELGLEKIYIQAKNQKSKVGSPKIQEFVGALHGKKANKGIFITSGEFTENAQDYSNKIDNKKVVLIDENTLARYMLRYDLGVLTTNTFKIKKVDLDFFKDI